MANQHKKITQYDIRAVRALYGFIPLDELSHKLGRTNKSIVLIALNEKIKPIDQRYNILTVTQFAHEMGIIRSAARRLAQDRRFSLIMYRRNRPVFVIAISSFKTWLKKPDNWVHFDDRKIINKEFRHIIDSRERVWFTVQEVADMLGYSYRGMVKVVWSNRIKYIKAGGGRKGKKLIFIHADEIEKFKEKQYEKTTG